MHERNLEKYETSTTTPQLIQILDSPKDLDNWMIIWDIELEAHFQMSHQNFLSNNILLVFTYELKIINTNYYYKISIQFNL